MADTIKVCCRFRSDPKNEELDDWTFDQEIHEIRLREKKFTFDEVMDMSTSQDQMYEKVASKAIADYVSGYHGTIFAYGNSGSGKTYSIVGPDDIVEYLSKDFNSVPENIQNLYGIIPRATLEIFSAINSLIAQGATVNLKASYIEIYNESITCLLNGKEQLKIHEVPRVGFAISGKEERPCLTPEDIFKVLYIGTKNKTIGGTNQNARSSRSHTLLTLELYVKTLDGSERLSKLNIVDLAGSEKLKNTGVTTPERLKEAQKINLSLTTLGMCIMALTENASFIPFRNSKLTLLLKESLCGNSKTTLLCAARRDKKLADDNLNSLYFAQRAKSIKTQCKKNVKLSEKETEYLINALKTELIKMRGQIKEVGFVPRPITDSKILELLGDIDNISSEEVKDKDKVIVKSDGTVKRNSLINLSEEEIILKYINLRAKYDNLLESATQKIYSLTEQNVVSDDHINEINQLKNSHREEILNITAELENLKSNLQLKEDLIQLETKKHKSEAERYENEIKSMQDIIDLNSLDIEAMTDELNKAEDESKKYKREVEDTKKIVDFKDNEISRLKALLEEKEGVIHNQSKTISERQEQIDTLTSMLKLQTDIKSNENEDLSNKLKITNDLVESLKKMKEDIFLSSKDEVENLKKENQLLKDNKTASEREYDQRILFLTTEKEGLHNQIKDLNESISNKNREFDKLIGAKNSEILKLKEEIEKLKNEISTSSISNSKLIDSNLSYEKRIDEMNHKINVLQNENIELKEKISQLKLSINNTRQAQPTENTTIKSKVDFKMFGITLLKTTNKFIEQEKEVAKEKKKRLNSLFGDKLEELNALRENIDNLTPKTVSSHNAELDGVTDIDFTDKETYMKAQKILEEKEKERIEKKRLEMELKNKK